MESPSASCPGLSFMSMYRLSQLWEIRMGSELCQKTKIVFKVKPDIVDAVTKQSHSFDPHTEGIARVFFRVITDILQDVRMNHSRTSDLEPTIVLADRTSLLPAHETGNIHVCARFGKREECRPELVLHRASVVLPGERDERPLPLAHGNIPVHIEPLELVEDHVASGADRFIAVDAPGHDDANRGLLSLHHPNLDRRCMGAQENVLRYKKGILHIARRMIGGKIQSGKVMEIVLNIRARGNSEAHSAKDGLQFFQRLGDGMLRAGRPRPTRQGNIELLRKTLFSSGQRSLFAVEFSLNEGTQLIQCASYDLFLISRDAPEFFEQLRDNSLAAQVLDAKRFQILFGSGSAQFSRYSFSCSLDFFDHGRLLKRKNLSTGLWNRPFSQERAVLSTMERSDQAVTNLTTSANA